MTDRSAPGSFGPVLVGSVVVVVGVFPMFLTGAMAMQVTAELGFGAAGLGRAAATFRAAQGVASPALGRLADRLGVTWSLRAATLTAAVAMLGVATTATSLAALCVWLAVGALSTALGQPGVNRLLIRRIPPGRRGLAFGVKQSAPPASSMLAGLAVPAIAVTVGWRWGFVAGASLALVVLPAIRCRTAPAARTARAAERSPTTTLDRPRLVVLMAIVFGLSAAAAAVVPTFFVDAAAAAGGRPEVAGTILAIGGLAAIGTRLVVGALTDRMLTRPLRVCAGLVGVGALGLVMLATGAPGLMGAGAILAMAAGWGFNGLFWHTLVTAYAATPGRITGAVAPGGSIGSTLALLMFGHLADARGYELAWAVWTAIGLVGAAGMLVGDRLLRARAHDRNTGASP